MKKNELTFKEQMKKRIEEKGKLNTYLYITLLSISAIILICTITFPMMLAEFLWEKYKKDSKRMPLDDKGIEEYSLLLVNTFVKPVAKFLKVENDVKVILEPVSSSDTDNQITFGYYSQYCPDDYAYIGLARGHYVKLFYRTICKTSHESKTIFTFKFLSVLAHEFAHAKQFETGALIVENYIEAKTDFVAYKKQDVEVDADKKGLVFVIIFAIDIIKFIFKKDKK